MKPTYLVRFRWPCRDSKFAIALGADLHSGEETALIVATRVEKGVATAVRLTVLEHAPGPRKPLHDA